MSLQWDESLRIGHAEIDGQHQELFAHFNTFLEACHQRQGREKLEELFEFLAAYVVLHFHAEEELMTACGYPRRNEHLQQHQDFRQQIADLRRELQQGGAALQVLIRTNKALLFWLTNHITKVDRSFGRFLADQQQVEHREAD